MTTDNHRPASTPRQQRAALGALLGVAVLVASLGTITATDSSNQLASGESVPLWSALYNGDVHEVLLPGATLTLQVGRPIDEISASAVDTSQTLGPSELDSDDVVHADDGSELVPVTWKLRRSGLATSDAPIDDEPIDLRLVAGDQTVVLAHGTVVTLQSPDGGGHPPSSVVSVTGGADLVIEVEMDGATQTLDIASGELDTGRASGLYEETAAIDTGCEQPGSCELAPTNAASPWRPRNGRAQVTTSSMSRSAYDAELGWAPEGRLWAVVYARASSVTEVVDRDGGFRTTESVGPLAATLDGAAPKRTSGFDADSDTWASQGWAVFSVDVTKPPSTLELTRAIRIDGDDTPQDVELATSLTLDRDG